MNSRRVPMVIGIVYRRSLLLSILLAALCYSVHSQKVAVLGPASDSGLKFAADLSEALSGGFRIVDSDMAAAAYRSVKVEQPFNLTLDAARQIGSVIGCDFFVLVDSAVQRRAGLERPDYFEAYGAVFVVSSRTGRLVRWELKSAEAGDEKLAGDLLLKQVPGLANSIAFAMRRVAADEARELPLPPMEEVPVEGSPAAKDFRAPVPYRRIKPEYTSDAYLHNVTATVDISVDLDTQGKVLRTEVTRWAGYGLDEAVIKAVNTMNWRPAERNGKALPIRFLLRYNFKKVDKE